MMVFIRVCPVLKSLPQIGTRARVGQLDQGGDVDGQVGGAVRERDAELQRRVGVEHARRDGGVVGAQSGLEGGEVGVDVFGAQEALGAAAPDHDRAARRRCAAGSASMSAMICSARSSLFAPCFTCGPSSRLT